MRPYPRSTIVPLPKAARLADCQPRPVAPFPLTPGRHSARQVRLIAFSDPARIAISFIFTKRDAIRSQGFEALAIQQEGELRNVESYEVNQRRASG